MFFFFEEEDALQVEKISRQTYPFGRQGDTDSPRDEQSRSGLWGARGVRTRGSPATNNPETELRQMVHSVGEDGNEFHRAHRLRGQSSALLEY